MKDRKVKVTKEVEFAMAHALTGYDGLCRNIHGHTYKLQVTYVGVPIRNTKNPKDGMVIDFTEVKECINIIKMRLDHALMLRTDDKRVEQLNKAKDKNKLIVFSMQPTAENMVIWIADELAKEKYGRLLYSVRLYETPTSYAEINL